MAHLRREHVVGIRTDLPSCKVRVGRLISYPCDNLCVLSDPTTTRSRQCFVETTKSNHSLVAYDVSNDGTLLALTENDPTGNSSSLVSLYSLRRTCIHDIKEEDYMQQFYFPPRYPASLPVCHDTCASAPFGASNRSAQNPRPA